MEAIKTARLLLRRLEEKDIPQLMRIANDPLLRKHIGDTFPHPYDLAAAQFWVREGAKWEYGNQEFGIFLGETLIGGGGIELGRGRELKTMHVGYRLGEEYRGQGYATEFLQAMVDFAFKTYNIERMRSGVYAYNPASAKVMEKCGFLREACLRNAIFYNGELVDCRMYGLTRADYEKKKEL
ncbi:MAG: hypothetical protein DLD55_06420 [candidate division SR1 bacterium]|nr:MAG: hypothetical protein DLD55_06420 [candidate division SR1 bacterium]